MVCDFFFFLNNVSVFMNQDFFFFFVFSQTSVVTVRVGWAALPCSEQASHCSGFSCCRTQAVGKWASGVAAPGAQGLWLMGSRALT